MLTAGREYQKGISAGKGRKRMSKSGSILFLVLILAPSNAPAQSGWKRSDADDGSYISFSLDGRFLQAPLHAKHERPSLDVIYNPKYHGLSLSILVWSTLRVEQAPTGKIGVSVQFSVDDGQVQSGLWRTVDDDCDSIALTDEKDTLSLLYRGTPPYKKGAIPQIKKIVVKVPDRLGGDIVMQFDLPDSTAIAELRGLVENQGGSGVVDTGTARIPAQGGPFGFDRGMTRAQVIALVGQDAVDIEHSKDDLLRLKTAPKPHPAFDSYLLIISPEQGLLKVLGSGKTVDVGDDGADLKQAFEVVVDGLTQKYGAPTRTFDFCNGGTGCSDQQYWMMGLLQKNRKLEDFWELQGNPVHVTIIDLEATALSMNSGYVSLGYEFEGWSQYVDEKKAKQNQSF